MKLLVLMLTLLSSGAASPQDLRADISQTETSIIYGQPLVVVLQLSATDGASFNLAKLLGPNLTGNIRFIVRDPNGLKRTAFLPVPSFYTVPVGMLVEGSPYVKRLDISSLLQPLRTGLYSIDVDVMNATTASPLISADRPVMVEVGPPDSDRLLVVCKDLKDRIEKSSSAAEQIELSSELARIHDPVAVPFMRSLIGKNVADNYMLIRSLGEIGNSEAIDALQSSLSSMDPTEALVAKHALKSIAGSTRNESLRKRAMSALGVLSK